MSAARRSEMRRYATGYGLSLLLTAGAFGAVHWQVLTTTATLGIVFSLGLAQTIVHFRCFLEVSFKRSAREDLQLLLFSALIIALMISGTIVILFNLRARMM